MTGWLTALAAGTAAGVLSAFGVGGGTLLLVYMTAFAGLPQAQAQGINLLFFLPAAGLALPAHIKHGYVARQALLPAVSAGLICAAVFAWAATALDPEVLRRCFGLFLLFTGLRELLTPAPGGDGQNRPSRQGDGGADN